MQGHNAAPSPSNNQPTESSPAQRKTSYVPPVIPMGLSHVVQYVTGSLLHMPGSLQLMADRMSRYANADGEVSIALEFLCRISDLGSKNTAKGYIDKLTAMDMLETVHGQGGNERRSNTYRFLGARRNWQPLPGEEPGTDPWLTLLEVRLENEELRNQVRELTTRVQLLTNGGTDDHPEVTNGDGPPNPDGYETPSSQGNAGAIGQSKVTNGDPLATPEKASHSYENADSDRYSEEGTSIGHPEVTNGPAENPPREASHSYEITDSGSPQGDHGAIGHTEATNGSTEGQQYLARRARVEEVVLQHRAYFQRSFSRRGVLGAIEFFSRSDENEQDLLRQVRILDAGEEPGQTDTGPPAQAETTQDADRYAVGECPDCGKPFATYGGAEFCMDCTERRRRKGEA